EETQCDREDCDDGDAGSDDEQRSGNFGGLLLRSPGGLSRGGHGRSHWVELEKSADIEHESAVSGDIDLCGADFETFGESSKEF
ncbi:MAG: hypothetical protein RLZZ436_2548, partial [Planctomycetota bacterium]